jgi:hypothetical protein
MNNEQAKRVNVIFTNNEAVKFSNVISRLPTEEEKQLVLRALAEVITNDMINIEHLDEAFFESNVQEVMDEHRGYVDNCCFVTDFQSLGIRLVIINDFSIMNVDGETDHFINTYPFRYVIEDNNKVYHIGDDETIDII